MRRVIVIVEGQTEESFVAGPLYSELWPLGTLIQPILIGVPGRRGGNVTFQRVVNDVVRTLKQDQNVFCSTLLDLYGLGKGFVGLTGLPIPNGYARAQAVEDSLKEEVIKLVPDWTARTRFIPYVQVHEFEGLLFSSPEVLAQAMFKPELVGKLQSIRNSVESPEDINESPDTAPSKRILNLDSNYKKVVSGSLAAEQMGVSVIRQHCPRFNKWVNKLANLGVAA